MLCKQILAPLTASAAAGARRHASMLARAGATPVAATAAATLPSAAAAAAARPFSSSLRLAAQPSAPLMAPAAAAAPANFDADGLPTKKMNLFTALNDAMSEALRTDPKVTHAKANACKRRGMHVLVCDAGDCSARIAVQHPTSNAHSSSAAAADAPCPLCVRACVSVPLAATFIF